MSDNVMDQKTQTTEDAQFVTLGIDREVFAVPVEAVLEILDMRPVFRVPDAPPYLAGLIDVRGRGVPVIDLRVKLGLPSVAATEHTRVIVLEISLKGRQLVLGLIADRVFEVAALNAEQITPPPDIGVTWRSDYIRGVAHSGESFVVIFDLVRLFSGDEIIALDKSGSQNRDPATNAIQSPAAAVA